MYIIVPIEILNPYKDTRPNPLGVSQMRVALRKLYGAA